MFSEQNLQVLEQAASVTAWGMAGLFVFMAVFLGIIHAMNALFPAGESGPKTDQGDPPGKVDG